MYKNGVKTISF